MEEKKESLKDQAFHYIKNRIIKGEYPPGHIIDEKEISQILGISRTPVHEAVGLLAAQNLVTIASRKNITVTYLKLKDILHIYEARKIIETNCLPQIISSFDKEKLESFTEAFNNTEMISSTDSDRDLDSEFHLYLISCTKNTVLMEIEEMLMTQCQRIRVLSSATDIKLDRKARTEHIDLIDAIISGDIEDAQKKCIVHLENSIQYYMNIFKMCDYII